MHVLYIQHDEFVSVCTLSPYLSLARICQSLQLGAALPGAQLLRSPEKGVDSPCPVEIQLARLFPPSPRFLDLVAAAPCAPGNLPGIWPIQTYHQRCLPPAGHGCRFATGCSAAPLCPGRRRTACWTGIVFPSMYTIIYLFICLGGIVNTVRVLLLEAYIP